MTIRQRLLQYFVLVALLPAIAISIGSIALGYTNGRQQVLDRLNSVISLKQVEIVTWLDTRHNELVFLSNNYYNLERIQTILKLSSQDKYYPFYSKALQNSFLRLVTDSSFVEDFSLLDLTGKVVLSTSDRMQGRRFAQEEFFLSGLNESTARFYFDEGDSGKIYLVSAIPIFDVNGNSAGVLISRSLPDVVALTLREPTGMGQTGKSYLVTEGQILISSEQMDGKASIQEEQKTNASFFLAQDTSLPPVYSDYYGKQVMGVNRWVDDLQANLVVEQDLSEAFATIFTSLGVNLAITVFSLFLAIALSLAVTRRISTPVEDLSRTAARIAAGDFDQFVPVRQRDEIGNLADSFNSMTRQLRDLINSLERRVQERTQTLQQRALQLETSSQVSREITSILDIETLLERIVERIRASFGYYHVNIFLLEKNNDCLRSWASSPLGSISSLTLDLNSTSLNGKAAYLNEPVIVNDVRSMPEYFPLEQLAETRSELVIPLRIGENVIGTLDVQSREPDRFSPEDVMVIQSLGDQIAIAIENARLYKQSQRLAIVEERNRLARNMHDSVIQSLYSLGLLIEGWSQMSADGETLAMHDVLTRTAEINQQVLRELRLLIHELRPPVLEKEGLVNALQKRLEVVESRAGFQARLLAEDFSRLPALIEEELYRIAGEALNNTLKHSRASHVIVRLYKTAAELCLEISDNGTGFCLQTARESGGLGLASMQERAKNLGGYLCIETGDGGTTIRVCVGRARVEEELRGHLS